MSSDPTTCCTGHQGSFEVKLQNKALPRNYDKFKSNILQKLSPESYRGSTYSRGQNNVSNFVLFRFVELPFPSETPFIYSWNSLRSISNRCRTCIRMRAVIHQGLTVKIFILAPVWVLPSRCFKFTLIKDLVSLPRQRVSTAFAEGVSRGIHN